MLQAVRRHVTAEAPCIASSVTSRPQGRSEAPIRAAASPIAPAPTHQASITVRPATAEPPGDRAHAWLPQQLWQAVPPARHARSASPAQQLPDRSPSIAALKATAARMRQHARQATEHSNVHPMTPAERDDCEASGTTATGRPDRCTMDPISPRPSEAHVSASSGEDSHWDKRACVVWLRGLRLELTEAEMHAELLDNPLRNGTLLWALSHTLTALAAREVRGEAKQAGRGPSPIGHRVPRTLQQARTLIHAALVRLQVVAAQAPTPRESVWRANAAEKAIARQGGSFGQTGGLRRRFGPACTASAQHAPRCCCAASALAPCSASLDNADATVVERILQSTAIWGLLSQIRAAWEHLLASQSGAPAARAELCGQCTAAWATCTWLSLDASRPHPLAESSPYVRGPHGWMLQLPSTQDALAGSLMTQPALQQTWRHVQLPCSLLDALRLEQSLLRWLSQLQLICADQAFDSLLPRLQDGTLLAALVRALLPRVPLGVRGKPASWQQSRANMRRCEFTRRSWTASQRGAILCSRPVLQVRAAVAHGLALPACCAWLHHPDKVCNGCLQAWGVTGITGT